jgi:hypothetical protein
MAAEVLLVDSFFCTRPMKWLRRLAVRDEGLAADGFFATFAKEALHVV